MCSDFEVSVRVWRGMFGKMEVCSGGDGDVRVLATGCRGKVRMTSVSGSFEGF